MWTLRPRNGDVRSVLSLGSVSLWSLLVLLLVFLVSSSASSPQGRGEEPPGPRTLPLLGNLLQLDLKNPHDALLKLSKKYGPVFTFYLGPKKVVVLAGFKTVKEALVNYADEFGDRDPLPTVKESKLEYGVVWTNGDTWQEMRRFTLTNLRDYGLGKKACEDKIIEECSYLTELFKTYKGEASAVSNIICSMVYGSRFEYDDPEFQAMVHRVNASIRLLGTPVVQLYSIFPSIGKWFSATREEIRSLVDANRQRNLKLFGPGGDQQVIGSRQVQVEDRKNLPFTDAVVHETQRLANVALMALPHRTSEDVTFQGHFIKKGTTVYPLLSSVLYDETEWEKPHSFYPAHFLDKDGKFVKRDAFMPFSAGRRACPGESLARMELFLFFATFLQNFRFSPPPGVSEHGLDLTPGVGYSRSPLPHKLYAVECQ